jgi:hypothetical protein
MAVEVVPVGRVDVVANPDAGIGEAHARRRQQFGEVAERPVVRVSYLL